MARVPHGSSFSTRSVNQTCSADAYHSWKALWPTVRSQARHLACLIDRIAFFEGRPQRYGTQFTLDDDGYTTVWRLERPNEVEELRRLVGLARLTEGLRPREQQTREQVARWRQEMDEWAESVGWRR